MIGRVLGSYRLVAKIGEGGMGAVYRAVDEMLDREAAIKAIRPDLAREPQIAERFRSEARLLARVQHSAIATIYSFFQAGENGEELYLAMEYVRGRTLAEVIAAEGPMPQARVVRLMGTAFDGIEFAHEAGIIHRDLKPENLMLTDGERIKVMDFGIARLSGESHLTRTGLLVGTLRYMAPEQIRGEEVDRRTDVYSLGIVLYQLLTGRVPFDGNTDYAILRAQLEEEPPALRSLTPAVSAEIERAVLRALAKDPAERFASVADLSRALRLALGPSAATGVRPAPRADLELDLDSTLPLPLSPSRASVAPASAPTSASGRPLPPPQTSPQTAPPPPPPPSLPTVATPRSRQEATPPPLPPPAAVSTSYRPIEGARGKTWAIAALAAVVVVGGGFGLWRSLHTVAPPADPAVANLAGTSEPADSTAQVQGEGGPAAAGQASQPPVGGGTATAANAIPSRPLPAAPYGSGTKPLETPPSASPSGSVPAGSPEAGIPEAPRGAAETSPAPAPGAPPQVDPAPQGDVASDLPPLEAMKRLSSSMVQEGELLTEVYQNFLDQKEDRNEEITANDQALRDEIEALNGAVERFDAFFNAGLMARARNRLRKPNEAATRLDLQRRAQLLAGKVARIDQLMAAVNPDADVRQSWGHIRADWQRARQRMAL